MMKMLNQAGSKESRGESVLKTLFIADGNAINLTLMEKALEEHYRVVTVSSVSKLFSLLAVGRPDMILLNAEMPDMSGIDALARLKSLSYSSPIPVILWTDAPELYPEAACLMAGAVDYIQKPVSKEVLLCRIRIHLKSSELVMTQLTSFQELQNNIVSILADMISQRDHATGGHILRTSTYIRILLDAMAQRDVYTSDMRNWRSETIVTSAQLHDVGKIVISDTILNKPGKLNEGEFSVIKTHTTEGERVIDRMVTQAGGGAFLSHAKVFAGSHHERWDGSGYPRGLKGEEIPLEGRVLAVADVYDALVSDRPYKKAFSTAKAEAIIMDEAGRHFDPLIVEVFESVRDHFEEISRVGGC